MKINFWQKRWDNNDIGFHEGQFNPYLLEFFPQLKLPSGATVFVPLCGKSRDIAWLLAQSYQVVAVEFIESAVQQLFKELEVTPKKSMIDNIKCYQHQSLKVFVGDFFELSAQQLGKVDAVYDRAALVALKNDVRRRYADHLLSITRQAPQLLQVWEYQQNLMPGPPFSVSNDEIAAHYGKRYQHLHSEPLTDKLKGKVDALLQVYLVNPEKAPPWTVQGRSKNT